MEYRDYDPDRDFDQVSRLWHEVGWTNQENEAEKVGLRDFMSIGPAIVAEVNGNIECMVITAPGQIIHGDTPITMSAVAAVITGMPARKTGLAGRLTAASVARETAKGAPVSALGIFEQGFYDRLGFGNGPYELHMRFAPADINVHPATRPPHRLTTRDFAAMHESRVRRMRLHGRVNIDPPGFSHYESTIVPNGFGLGYYDGPGGSLSHHIWCFTEDLEHGPLKVQWMSYENWDQFRELMGVLRNLGDQFYTVSMAEPAGIQLQDFVRKPISAWMESEGKHNRGMGALSYYQLRINDVAACMSQTNAKGDATAFNLKLSDPIVDKLPDGSEWQGVGGEYVIHLGQPCSAEYGQRAELPTLEADVNAFTRMWLGVRPASGLAVTANLSGPERLLKTLDEAFLYPTPSPDWEF